MRCAAGIMSQACGHYFTLCPLLPSKLRHQLKAFAWREALDKSIFDPGLCNDHRTVVHNSSGYLVSLWQDLVLNPAIAGQTAACLAKRRGRKRGRHAKAP